MVNRVIIHQKITISRMKFGWSKHGGARYGLMRQGGDWSCQCCGESQPAGMPAYMFPYDAENLREFLRICAVCENFYKEHKSEIKDFYDLIEACRDRHLWWK
jgi:hypothetical protein